MKLLIIGSGPDWEKAPFDDRSFQVWTYGLIAHLLPHVDAIFEMHKRDYWKNFNWSTSVEDYTKRLIELDKPIFMCEEHADIPQSIKYPLNEVEDIVGSHFASTLSYQLGLAILRQKQRGDIEEIVLFGFELRHWEEWAYQRPNVNRLIGFAQGLGIKVSVPKDCGLVGVQWRYGYEQEHESVRVSQALIDEDMAQLASMMARIGEHQVAMAEARRQERGLLPPTQGPL